MTTSRAAALCAASRKRSAVAALSGSEPLARLARWHGASRKFVRVQRDKARQAIDEAFAVPPEAPDVEPCEHYDAASGMGWRSETTHLRLVP